MAAQRRAAPARQRLFEQVASAPASVDVVAPQKERLPLPGVGAMAATLADAPVRFVLDAAVSARCRDRIRLPVAFDVACDRLRLPAQVCWIEWIADQVPGCRADQKYGALIQTDAGGRSGRMTCYYETRHGQADLLVMAVVFDLDRPIRARAPLQHRLRHNEMPHLASLFEHMVGEFDPNWWRWVSQDKKSGRAAIAELANGIWYALPLTLAFLELLDDRRQAIAARNVLEGTARCSPASASERILDVRLATDGFAEVSLTLNQRCDFGSGSAVYRSQPRAHVVRGHLVTRAGKTFWRRAHQRGDGAAPIKVVSVYL